MLVSKNNNPLKNLKVYVDVILGEGSNCSRERVVLGRKVKIFEINKPDGRQTVEINLSNLSSGEYILSIRNGVYISKKKIMKQ